MTAVVAVVPEPHLREAARRSAVLSPVPIDMVDSIADRLPGDDATFDCVVASLVLCSVPDLASALREMRRVLRVSGEIRFFEHVRASTPALLRTQRFVDATVWPHHRFRFPDIGPPTPTSPHVLGIAVKR